MKRFAIVGFNEKTGIKNFLSIINELKKKMLFDFDLFLYKRSEFELYDTLNMPVDFSLYNGAIAIGGDGTFLYCSRVFAGTGIPIFGVNMGNIGFNMRIEPKDFEIYLDMFLKDECTFEQLDALDVEIDGQNKTYTVINEGVISHGGISRILDLKVSSCGYQIYDFSGDGMIVSTATGSTAYNLSAGGPILHPSLHAISLVPICPHTLTIRPYIIPIEQEVSVKFGSSSVPIQLTLDGQKTIQLNKCKQISFTKSHKSITIVKTKKIFSEILKEKLGWSV